MTSGFSRYLTNPGPKIPVTAKRAAVTTDSAIVTETIVSVLRGGGNAADAGVAGALVQAAVEPHMTNHAGLVTCLYYEAATRKIHQLDSLGSHPSGLKPFRPMPRSSQTSAIIPGFMPGLKELHTRFGTRPWRELCAPAIYWAEHGHPVTSLEYGAYASSEKDFYFAETREFFHPKGMLPSVGDLFVPLGLAQTLRAVADEGPDHMIDGPWAKQFVAKANAMGWKIELAHMTETPPRWLEPVRYQHHEYEIVSLGPPQAQGLYIGVALGVLKHLGVRQMQPGSADYFWAMGHALRQATRHWEYAQDETIYGVPKDEVLDDGYHAHLAKMIRKSLPKVDLTEHVRLSDESMPASDVMSLYAGEGGKPHLGDSQAKQPSGSCEFAATDVDGNWLQLMNTTQGSGIPGVVIGGVTMSGSHATFGALMSSMDATLVKGAKERCIIGNTFVLRNSRPVLSAGSPGNVHCTVPQFLTYVLDLGLDAYEAVDAPRMLPMDEARVVTIEDRLLPGVVEDLHRIGVRVAVVPGYDPRMGSFAVILRDEASGLYTAIADPRRCGVADGIA